MSDLISRDDAIRELNGVCSTWEDDAKVQEIIMAIPSAKQTGDLISRADAIDAVRKELVCDGRHETHDKTCRFIADVLLSALPSADAVEYESTVTLNSPISISAEAVQTQAEKCDECIHKWTHKDKTTCKECVSAEAVQGEWVRKYDDKVNCYWYECDQCGEYRPRNQFGHEYNANFCPNCGARMKGGDSE